MQNNKYLTVLSLFILFPSIIYADCTDEEVKHFKEIEKDYKVTYEFNKDTKDYKVTFYSPEPDMYDYYWFSESLDSKCKVIDDKTIDCNNVIPDTYEIEIIGVTDSCYDTLKKSNLKLPKYNNYSSDPLCEGIEEFVLCSPTYDKNIDYDTFVSRVNTYKKNLNNQKEPDEINTNQNENKLLEYIEDNLFQIIIITVFIIMLVITIILTAKSIRKSRRLE